MAHIATDFCRQLSAARRARGMTQSTLARSVGCAQSAISMFESGHTEKLSMDFVRKIAELLEIPMEKTESPDSADGGIGRSLQKGYCPNPSCLSNIPYVINSEIALWPTVVQAGDETRYCVVCGEVLELRCPTCGGEISEGAFCGGCGRARVEYVPPAGRRAEDWLAERRAEIREMRGLARANNGTPP